MDAAQFLLSVGLRDSAGGAPLASSALVQKLDGRDLAHGVVVRVEPGPDSCGGPATT
ncbi:MAG: hypothetical protein OXU20_30380 [Myxococcales bacterium]|nr:hypothetical protein [Myxococcales bacterium]MDD9971593.1 hypothetical protein [Myxococcales bacterium]